MESSREETTKSTRLTLLIYLPDVTKGYMDGVSLSRFSYIYVKNKDKGTYIHELSHTH